MLDSAYKRRVGRDLPSWVENGWVDAEKADTLLASIKVRSLQSRLPGIIGMLGAILLAFAAMTFVAANWHDIPKLGRVGILIAALWASYAAAAWLKARGWSAFFEAAVALGCGIFGANIMLIAQMYHIDRHYPDGVMVWGAGTLIAAVLSRSTAAAIFGFGLLALWTGQETLEFDVIGHWKFLWLWTPAAIIVFFFRWTGAVNAAGIALFFWIAVTVFSLADEYNWPDPALLAILALMSVAFFMAAVRSEQYSEQSGRIPSFGLSSQCLLVFMGLVFLLQIVIVDDAHGDTRLAMITGGLEDNPWIALLIGAALAAAACVVFLISRGGIGRIDALILLAAIAAIAVSPLITALKLSFIIAFAVGIIALSIWLINLGQRRHHNAAINIGFLSFAAETLYVYFETLGTLLDTALFFLVGGAGLVVLAFGLERIRRKLIGTPPATSAEAQA